MIFKKAIKEVNLNRHLTMSEGLFKKKSKKPEQKILYSSPNNKIRISQDDQGLAVYMEYDFGSPTGKDLRDRFKKAFPKSTGAEYIRPENGVSYWRIPFDYMEQVIDWLESLPVKHKGKSH